MLCPGDCVGSKLRGPASGLLGAEDEDDVVLVL
jgi:hypothetical protein